MIYENILKATIIEALKKAEMEPKDVTITTIERSGGRHNQNLKFRIEVTDKNAMGNRRIIMFNVEGMPTGCGILTFSQFVSYLSAASLPTLKLVFDIVADAYAKDGGGTMLATLGNVYYSRQELLEQLGFKQLAEYPNFKHNGTSTQRLFIFQADPAKYVRGWGMEEDDDDNWDDD